MLFVIGHPTTCTPNVVNMNAQVFRDPKSSNIIEISWFVKFLLTFDWFQGSTPLGGGVGVGGWGFDSVRVFGGVPHACAHAHTHARACAYMYKHDNFMQMAAPIGKSWGIPLWHHCMCVCGGAPPKHPDRVPPPSTHPHPPGGQTPEISQKSIKI